jgi:glycosyltransferase involved in cell wall biosynthesis
MPSRPLRIAWLGPVPGGDAGVVGVNTQLLRGLAALGHRIDCFFPSAGHPLPPHLAEDERLEFIWGTSRWQWNRWYSRTKIAAFASGMLSRGLASVRLRRTIARRHRQQPYDVIYQFSYIETFAVPAKLRRSVPLVIHPETHIAGELRCLIAERRLSLNCQPRRIFVVAILVMAVRTLIQRISIRRARLLVCISSVFRDHLVADYGFPLEATVVVPNPVRIDRFRTAEGRVGKPPRVLVLGRISTRKGIEDVVAVAKTMLRRGVEARLSVAGGPTLWSDYTKLLEDLPSENAGYLGQVSADAVPQLLLESEVLLQASKYEPFALTVAEALAAGVPVVATTEVGAIEGVDASVAYVVAPGDVDGMSMAIETLARRLAEEPTELRRTARAEAQRLFAPDVVCAQISSALTRLVGGAQQDGSSGAGAAPARPPLRA